MSEKKIIAVVGATGAQGGGLVRAILADSAGPFAVRAITRDTSSDGARELARLGAEVVAADIDSEDSLAQALQGAYGAYFVTFFWAHFSPEKELAEARNMANAAKRAGLQHVVWSTLEDTRKDVPLSDDRMPTLMGQYKVPHFDAKGEANQIFRDAGVPTTFLHTSFYWDNFIHFGLEPKKTPDGKYVLTLPMGDKRLAGIAAEDIGKTAYGVFKRGAELIGKDVFIAGDHVTGERMAQAIGAARGVDVSYYGIPPAEFRAFGFPGADDLGNMFQYYADFEKDFCGRRDLAATRALNPELQSFDDWLARNKDRIPLA